MSESRRTSLGPTTAQQNRAHERIMARWEKRAGKWPWRDYLTSGEANVLRLADIAKARWLALNKERAAITNRAIQRAKYDAKRESS